MPHLAKGSRLRRMDPEKRKGVCGTTDILGLRSWRPTVEMSTSSISIAPLRHKTKKYGTRGTIAAAKTQVHNARTYKATFGNACAREVSNCTLAGPNPRTAHGT